MIAALLIGVIGAAFHYLTYHAVITSWLWKRYPAKLDALLSCAACSGTWVGLGMAAYFSDRGVSVFGVPPDDPVFYAVAAAVGMIATPLVSTIHLAALRGIHGDQEQP
jgi:hypothetical protein